MVIVGVGVGVVVAVNPPDLGQVENWLQLLVERALRLQIAQEHHGRRPVLAHGLDDVVKIAVGVAGEENAPHGHSPPARWQCAVDVAAARLGHFHKVVR